MAQDYNFTFQNLNTAPSGWTGNAIVNSPAAQSNLYSTPFDLVDPTQAVKDQTAANPTGTGNVASNLADAQGLLQRNTQLLRNLTKSARNAQSGDMLTQANEEIVKAQADQARLQKQVDSFLASTKSPEQTRLDAHKAAADASLKASLATQIERHHALTDKQKQNLDAHTHSIDALKEAIKNTQDPRVIQHLNNKLASEQTRFAKEQAQATAENTHLTSLQAKLTSLNAPPAPVTPPPGTTPPATPPPGSTPAPGTTPSKAPAGPLNYWQELVDKQLGSRSWASGWHSADSPAPAVPPVAPAPVAPAPVAPAAPVAPVTPPGTPPVVPGAPPPRALSPNELRWRAAFDPRGWSNSLNIPSPTPAPAPVVAPPVLTPPPPVTGRFGGASGGGWT